MRMWDKGVASDVTVLGFTAGRDRELDEMIAVWDIVNSMAHAVMLNRSGLLSEGEKSVILEALHTLYVDAADGKLVIAAEAEDIHSHIESALGLMTGNTGMKIHAGRSRNDQVLTDIYLYLREEASAIGGEVYRLLNTLVALSDRYSGVMLPGYTHMQPAMPSSFGLWFGSWAESLCDDIQMIGYATSMVNANPSGTAAGYGTTLPLKREVTTELLHFDRLIINPAYAQLRRGKAEKVFADAIASVAFTLARLAGDICLFMTKEFSFVGFGDEYTTGSSIMPQKKNPDVFEIIRARANVLRAVPNTLSMMVTNLPSGYNRDFQIIKEVLFPAVKEIRSLIAMTTYMLPGIKIKEGILDNPMYNPVFSAEAANRLVTSGVPFREAYRTVASQVEGTQFMKTQPSDYTHTGSIGNTCTGEITSRAGQLMQQVVSQSHSEIVAEIMKT
jgi:argininosuccinate lyase